MTRDEAWQLLTEFTRNESLLKHALAVEAAMGHYARKFGEDEEKWRVVGLLHDFDYEVHPTLDKHPQEGAKILRQRGVSEEIVEGVISHADHVGVPRDTLMKKTLYAVDELTGFVIAVALVRPNKSVLDVEPSSVRKKMKDKAFARAVNRDDIVKGAEELGVPLEEHLGEVIEALKGVAGELGLRGTG
jgi:putative nucleotidyltransferase with HDIG domain